MADFSSYRGYSLDEHAPMRGNSKDALTYALLETVRLVLQGGQHSEDDDEDQHTSSPAVSGSLRRHTANSRRAAVPLFEESDESSSQDDEPSDDSPRRHHGVPVRRRAGSPRVVGVAGGPCAHCGATESPQWRRPLAKKVVLCNACGIYYSRHHAMPKRKKAGPNPRRAPPLADDGGDEDDGGEVGVLQHWSDLPLLPMHHHSLLPMGGGGGGGNGHHHVPHPPPRSSALMPHNHLTAGSLWTGAGDGGAWPVAALTSASVPPLSLQLLREAASGMPNRGSSSRGGGSSKVKGASTAAPHSTSNLSHFSQAPGSPSVGAAALPPLPPGLLVERSLGSGSAALRRRHRAATGGGGSTAGGSAAASAAEDGGSDFADEFAASPRPMKRSNSATASGVPPLFLPPGSPSSGTTSLGAVSHSVLRSELLHHMAVLNDLPTIRPRWPAAPDGAAAATPAVAAPQAAAAAAAAQAQAALLHPFLALASMPPGAASQLLVSRAMAGAAWSPPLSPSNSFSRPGPPPSSPLTHATSSGELSADCDSLRSAVLIPICACRGPLRMKQRREQAQLREQWQHQQQQRAMLPLQ